MKLTILGNNGPYPSSQTGANSGYLIEENGTKIVLDMGAGTLAKLMNTTDIKDIDAIYISHLHFDHTSDLLPFRYLLDDLGLNIKILTQKEDSEWYRTLFTHPKFDIINIDENTELDLNGLKLSFCLLSHPAKDYGIKIRGEKTFVYTGDTVMCDNLYELVKGADAVLCDCAKPADFKGPHMSSADAVKLHKETGVKIIATHICPGFDAEKEFADIDGITVTENNKAYFI